MAIRVSIWLAERICEIATGAVIALLYFGSNHSAIYPGVGGDLLVNASFVMFFYLASGFIASVVYFGLVARRQTALFQGLTMGVAFLVHLTLLTLFVGHIELKPGLILAGFGFIAVVVINSVGSAVLLHLQRDES